MGFKVTGELKEGWYRASWVKGGPKIDAFIDDVGFGTIGDQNYSAEKIALFGEKITEKEYFLLRNQREWAEKHAPFDPLANPTNKINPGKLPVVF